MRGKFIGLMLLTILAMGTVAETIDDFEGGYFKIIRKDPDIYSLDVGIDSFDDGLIPMAYADINSDS